jgi:hypothetical protein
LDIGKKASGTQCRLFGREGEIGTGYSRLVQCECLMPQTARDQLKTHKE